MYSMFSEEIARIARREVELRCRFNTASERTRATRPTRRAPGGFRTAVAKKLFRTAFALAGDSGSISLLALRDEETCAC